MVTGANGFLGRHLCVALKAAGHTLTELMSRQTDLRNPTSLFEFNRVKYDQIYHLAAWTQAGDFCLSHPGEQWIINQQINTNVLTWWQAFQSQAKLLAIGSSCCYDENFDLVEENFLKGLPTASLFTYAMTKRMLYTGLMALHQQYGLKYLCVVPSTLYGADYHLDGRQMHFIFDLVRKVLEGKYRQQEVVLWGDGLQKRELIHVADFVRLAIRLMQQLDNDIINIGSGQEYSIRWYADTISRLINYDASAIRYDTTRYVGVRSKQLNISKLKALCPDFSPVPIENGIAEITRWYRDAIYPNG